MKKPRLEKKGKEKVKKNYKKQCKKLKIKEGAGN